MDHQELRVFLDQLQKRLGEGQGAVRITAEASDGTLYTTSTWDAGGYTLKLPPGTYRVTFEGGDAALAVAVLIDDETAGMRVEPVQGEGGIRIPTIIRWPARITGTPTQGTGSRAR